MSNTAVDVPVELCSGAASAGPVRELLPARAVRLGAGAGEGTAVRRLLPTLGRRMVGAWCFVDHYGPDEIGGVPFAEEIVMWWNFVARSNAEVAAARAHWQAGPPSAGSDPLFGAVPGYDGPALAAPEMPPTSLKPRGRKR